MADDNAKFDWQVLRRDLKRSERKRKIVEKDLVDQQKANRRQIDDLIQTRATLHSEVNRLSSELARRNAHAAGLLETFLAVKSDARTGSYTPRPVRFQRKGRSGAKHARFSRDHTTIADSGLFDTWWYLTQYPDVLTAKVDCIFHYLEYGAREGRDPNPLFSTSWYLAQNADVAASGLNPLVHYINHGEREGRTPSPHVTQEELNDFQMAVGSSTPALTFLLKQSPAAKLSALTAAASTFNSTQSARQVAKGVAFAAYQPTISIILPTYNSNPRFLRETIESVINQHYSKWQLCIVDDGSTAMACKDVLTRYEGTDSRIEIHFANENRGIAESSNQALAMAHGEYVGFLDHDDVLAQHALQEVVELLSEFRDTDFVYSDHAMIDSKSRFLHPAYKPGWSPEMFLSTNYIVHFKVVRTELMRTIGGFRSSTSMIQDLDVSLRLYEAKARIRHIPQILYFWREHAGSVASGTKAKPAIEKLALQIYDEHLIRRGLPARAEWPTPFQQIRVGGYKLRFPTPTKRCEMVVLCPDDAVDLARLQAMADGAGASLHIIFLRRPVPDSVLGSSARASSANDQTALNATILTTDAEYLVFVRPTARPMVADWLKELVGYLSMDDEIGAVGGKILSDMLKVKAGATVLLDRPMTIDRDEADWKGGYWFTNWIASNVEAVSSALLATRTDIFRQVGGIPIFEFADAAGLAFCLQLREHGLRIVYNPWSRIVDSAPIATPSDLQRKLDDHFGEKSKQDRYYNQNFSRLFPYLVSGPTNVA